MRHFLCVPYIESANVEKGTTYCILLCTKLLIPVLVYVLLVYCTGTVSVNIVAALPTRRAL